MNKMCRKTLALESPLFDLQTLFFSIFVFFRLHEFDEQVSAVREGMARVVPVPLLSLFTGYELETMVSQSVSRKLLVASVSPSGGFFFCLFFSVTHFLCCCAQVCGSPDIPLHLLKSVATYKGVEPTSALIQWFWEVMESFSNTERSLFLRFVWGRTRLPRTIADFRGRDFVVQVRRVFSQLVVRHIIIEHVCIFFTQ